MNRPPSLRLAVTVTAAAVVAALAPVPASATTGWDPGVFAFPEGTLTEHMSRMVVDDDGDRYVAFRDSAFDLRLVRIPADGPPEPPVTLTEDDGGSALYPQLAVDAEGDVTVVWQDNRRDSTTVSARTLDADGTLGTLHTLSRPGETAYEPQVVLDTAGTATVVWPVEGGAGVADDTLQMRRLDTGTDTPSGPVVVLDAPRGTAPDYAYLRSPDIAVDGEDRVSVTWVRDTGGAERRRAVLASRVSADGTPGPVTVVSDDATTSVDLPDVEVAPDGTATVVWTSFEPESQTWVNRLSATDGTAGTPTVVSAPGADSVDDAVVAVDPQGRATVVWQSYDATGVTSLRTRRVSAAGALEAPRPALGPVSFTLNRYDMLDAVADAAGRVTVAWVGDDLGAPRIHAVRIDEAGAASTTHRLGRAGSFDSFDEFVDVDVDAAGRASVAWVQQGAVRVRRSLPPGAPVSADTRFLDGPAEGAVTTDTTPTFVVEGDTVQSTLECSLDAAAWAPCASPYTTRVLGAGAHTLRARATDADGTAPDATPAVRTFTVQAPPPAGPSRACLDARGDLAQARKRVQRIKRSELPPRVKRVRLRDARQQVARAERAVRRTC